MLGNRKEERVTEETKGKVETILGAGTRFQGDIFTRGTIRIEGEVTGKLQAEGDVFIGEKGRVDTEIEARNVVVAGTVNGNILARNKLELLASGKVSGDIQTGTLKIDAGASFSGVSKPLKEEAQKGQKAGSSRSEASDSKEKKQ